MSLSARDEARNKLRPFGFYFEKTLTDLIKGIRAQKSAPAREKYIKESIAECRHEVNSLDTNLKSQAILKLAYLEMYGYDMSWAAFNVLDVMSSPKFQQKRIGYLAAIQSFRTDNDDVLMLATNLLKKDLNSAHHMEISVALSGIASIVTPALAQDVSDDILKMLNHSKPYVRKRAILAMYKVFLQYPEALRTSFDRLREKLSDPDASVVSATVNVICELAKINSKNYIVLAPPLYELLTTSTNNWMLIKILKLFSSLAPQEPRLKSKLLPPILSLIENTTAKSLLYECINCIVTGGMMDANDFHIADICVTKLRSFLETPDQNLKFVGLLALSKIIKIYPEFVSSNEDIILQCLNDVDLTIRQRALDMVSGVVTEENMVEIVQQLKAQLTPNALTSHPSMETQVFIPKSYRVEVIRKILEIGSTDMYKYVSDFEWYIDVLVELLELADGADEVSEEIGYQLRDMAVRIVELRDVIVSACVTISSRLYIYSKMPSVLPAVLWVVGEYAKYIPSPIQCIYDIMPCLQALSATTNGIAESSDSVSVSALVIGIQCLVKIFSQFATMNVGWTQNRASVVEVATNRLVKFFEVHSTSLKFEVQERATEFLELFKLLQQALEEHPKDALEAPGLLTIALPTLFNMYEINPVAPGSQFHIPVPVDLDLDTPINPETVRDDDLDLGEDDDWDVIGGGGVPTVAGVNIESNEHEWKKSVAKIIMTHENENTEEAQRRKQERLQRQQDDPFYISSSNTYTDSPLSSRSLTPDQGKTSTPESFDLNSVPISKLDISGNRQSQNARKPKTKVSIIRDEIIGSPDSFDSNSNTLYRKSSSTSLASKSSGKPSASSKNKNRSVSKFQSAFRVNASGLETFDLTADSTSETPNEIQQEVEKLRETIESKSHKKKKHSKKSHDDDEVAVTTKTKKKSSSKKKKVSSNSTITEQNSDDVGDKNELEPPMSGFLTSSAPSVSTTTSTVAAPVKSGKSLKKAKVRKAAIED